MTKHSAARKYDYEYENQVTPEAQLIRPGFKKSTTEAPAEKAAAYQAYQILHIGYFLLPLIAGIDKFFNSLVLWDDYVAPAVTDTLGINGAVLMLLVGVFEIVLGVGIAFKPKVYSYIFSAWLCVILVNLIVQGIFWDVALRDFALACGALALARLADRFGGRRLMASLFTRTLP